MNNEVQEMARRILPHSTIITTSKPDHKKNSDKVAFWQWFGEA